MPLFDRIIFYFILFSAVFWICVSVKADCKPITLETNKAVLNVGGFNQGCRYALLAARKDLNVEQLLLVCDRLTEVFKGNSVDFKELTRQLNQLNKGNN